MKRFFMFVLALVAITMMSSCNTETKTASATPTPSPTEASAPEPAPTATPSPTSIPTITPEPNLSHTTGLPFEGEYKPVMVVIENSPTVRPQTGLQTADVVYEVPVEGSITRFVCVFSDNVPSEVMPVRSCRVPFIYIQHEWDAVFMHYGGSGKNSSDHKKPYSVYGNALYKNMKIHVDGLSGKWDKYYKRVKDIKAPHNVKGDPALAQQAYDYKPEPLNWIFDSDVVYSGVNVNDISLRMCSNKDDYVSYTYDPEKDVYMRYMSGKVFKSKETGEQVSVKNIIVQYSTYKRSVSGIKLWKLVGNGAADFYIGGKLINGTWKRETEDSETDFFDSNGNRIALRPGNTWIHINVAE